MKLRRLLGLVAAILSLSFLFVQPTSAAETHAPAPALVEDPAGVLRLPEGLKYKEIVDWSAWLDWGLARGVDLQKPDMNVYIPLKTPLPDGTVGYLFTNHETNNKMGGVTRVALDRSFNMLGEPMIVLANLSKPCSGNLTPWGTILVGEESVDGYVWEIEPLSGSARPVKGLGRYAHETGVVDPHTGEVWSTDDANDPAKGRGAIYKFTPDSYGDLSSGKLYALDAANRRWIPIDNPELATAEAKAKGATFYVKPEDAEFGPDGRVYLSISETDQDGLHWGRVISVHPKSLQVKDFAVGSQDGLNMPDNLAFDSKGRLYIVEDSNFTNQVWVAERSGRIRLFADLVSGEVSGPWFTPDFKAMILSLQTPHHKTVVITGFDKK
ncbi:MAG TPA: alkaline phosphatase PhoX [Symbiobacteriaceae bacterium]|nr:alkaline phosphatase PhoX [Symbiobacteriaceae bacterium]